MNKDQLPGTARFVAGRLGEAAGRIVGDRQTVAQGRALSLAGRAQRAPGHTRRSIRRSGRR